MEEVKERELRVHRTTGRHGYCSSCNNANRDSAVIYDIAFGNWHARVCNDCCDALIRLLKAARDSGSR